MAERATGFHALTVSAIEELTSDAVALTFDVPETLRAAYSWTAGQHVAVRVADDEERRSYSICSAPGADLRIGVRRIPGGRFSTVALGGIGVGDPIEVMTPSGRFGAALPDLRRPVLVAAGSGITPVIALAAAALADERVVEVGLVVVNRSQESAMFLDELADLKDAHPARLNLVHVLTGESQESPLLTGRPDPDRFREIRARLLADDVDGWFLCGPQALVVGIRGSLVADGVSAREIHTELFHAELPVPVPVAQPVDGTTTGFRLGGRTSEVRVRPGEVVLDAVLRVRADAPYACKGGVCGTCRARVVTGEVAMDVAWALEPDEVAAGYVLTCQGRPTTARLELDYDA